MKSALMIRLATVLLAATSLAHAGTYTLSRAAWLLFNGTTQVGSYASETACADGAAALNITRTYQCKTTTTVNVTATSTSAPPTVNFTVSPTTIPAGGGTVLSWSSTNATACASSGPTWFGMNGAPSGGQWAYPTAMAYYAVTCTGPGGSTSSPTIVVNVGTPTPTASLSAAPSVVNGGQSSTLTWSSTNASACNASGGWSGTRAPSGSQSVTPTATTTYTITCTGTGSTSANSSTTITVTASGPVTAYTTTFAGTENPISEGGAWVRGGVEGLDWTNPKLTGGQAVASQAPAPSRYSDDIAHLAAAVAADQWAEGTVYLAPGYAGASHEVELLLRFQITPHNARGYEVLWGLTGYLAIVRWNGPVGNYTALYDPGLGSIPVPQNGDVLRAEIVGSTIRVFRNGVQVATVTDSTYATGQPGIGFWPVDGATPENMGWQDFKAGGW